MNKQTAIDRLGPAAEGYEYFWVPDPEWRLPTWANDSRKCRGTLGCPGTVVAELKRSIRFWKTGKSAYRWYGYCADHLYGRYIEDGRVWVWKCREVTS